ncbi:hypothetical protein [Bacillus velezensis]|uniref:hypothetical protein n=1 Tax=Bacillus velezensis TaxID=492670 RepID=UPI0015C737A8|nr:hypothetical protein [Bacillus velezensis]
MQSILQNERANKLGFKHYVIHNPKDYREIFENTGFIVAQTVNENEKTSVVYETE